MLKKGSKIYSILRGKCPRCHEGDFFKYAFTMNIFKVNKIQKKCSKCDLKYMIEPRVNSIKKIQGHHEYRTLNS